MPGVLLPITISLPFTTTSNVSPCLNSVPEGNNSISTGTISTCDNFNSVSCLCQGCAIVDFLDLIHDVIRVTNQ